MELTHLLYTSSKTLVVCYGKIYNKIIFFHNLYIMENIISFIPKWTAKFHLCKILECFSTIVKGLPRKKAHYHQFLLLQYDSNNVKSETAALTSSSYYKKLLYTSSFLYIFTDFQNKILLFLFILVYKIILHKLAVFAIRA